MSVQTQPRPRLRERLLGIAPQEASFARRGFREVSGRARQRLERVGEAFLSGHAAGLGENEPPDLCRRLDCVDGELRGFAYEGAAMAWALLGFMLPWRRGRLGQFLDGSGAPHAYMLHVGVGWALARLPLSLDRTLRAFDPLLRWLAVDGFGFHHGYFEPGRYVWGQRLSRRVQGYARHAFDQGLGRALWFVEGADVRRVPRIIACFPEARRSDLWAGVGLAGAYAGGVDECDLLVLRSLAGRFGPELAQGACFAAKARERAGNPAPHTEAACVTWCGLSAVDAAHMTDDARRALPTDRAGESYETWRRRIQASVAEHIA